MNRSAYFTNTTTCYPEKRSRAERAVNRHLLMRRLQNHVAMGILGSTALLIVFGMLLLILPAFQVHSIKVKGNDRIAEETVIAASGVSIGDEIMDLNKSEIVERIAQDENIERVSVSTSLNGVTIKIVEKEGTVLSRSANASAR